jgi:hypothetical protein
VQSIGPPSATARQARAGPPGGACKGWKKRLNQQRAPQRLAGSEAVTTGQPWSVDERSAYGSAATTARDEDQVAVVQAVVQMTR